MNSASTGAALAAICFVALSGSASAQSIDAVLRRLEVIEASNARLEKENTALRARVRRLEGVPQGPTAQTAPAAARVAMASTSVPAGAMNYAPPPMVTKGSAVAPPVWNWTGFYVGAQTGYALGGPARMRGRSPAEFSVLPADGWFGGGQVGFNYQFSPTWVAGVVADLSASDIGVQETFGDVFRVFSLSDLATVRGRVGFAWDSYDTHMLLYATGGAAWGNVKFTSRDFSAGAQAACGCEVIESSAGGTLVGYAIGAGAEWALLHNLTLNVEYLWIDLPERFFTSSNTILPTNPQPIGWKGSTAKVGLNWLFH
jgi:outer membrane immunogenic protein